MSLHVPSERGSLSLLSRIFGYGAQWMASIPLLFAIAEFAVALAREGLEGDFGIDAGVSIHWLITGLAIATGGLLLLLGRAALRRWLTRAVLVFLVLTGALVFRGTFVYIVGEDLKACGAGTCIEREARETQ